MNVKVEADAARIQMLCSQLRAFAGTAEAVAQRNVDRVRMLAMLDICAAIALAWLARYTYDWPWPVIVPLFGITAIPAVILWKINGILSSVVGLPARLSDSVGEVLGQLRGAEAQWPDADAAGESSAPAASDKRPRLAQIHQSAGLIREIRNLGEAARGLLTETGSALVLTNPLFAIVLGLSSAAAGAIILIAVVGSVVALL